MSTSRDDKIIDFIEQKPDCTWTQIVNHINPNSHVPTHKAIKRLADEKKIIRSKDKNNSSIHHFRINDSNTFMRVKTWLGHISQMVDLMTPIIKEVNEMGETLWQEYSKNGAYFRSPDLESLMDGLIYPYRLATNIILQRLLVEISNNKNLSEKDTTVLKSKIARLLLELIKQNHGIDYSLFVFIRDLELFREKMQNNKNNFGLKNSKISSELVATVAFILKAFEQYQRP